MTIQTVRSFLRPVVDPVLRRAVRHIGAVAQVHPAGQQVGPIGCPDGLAGGRITSAHFGGPPDLACRAVNRSWYRCHPYSHRRRPAGLPGTALFLSFLCGRSLKYGVFPVLAHSNNGIPFRRTPTVRFRVRGRGIRLRSHLNGSQEIRDSLRWTGYYLG